MFVDLDWPLNASSLLSASAELLVWHFAPITNSKGNPVSGEEWQTWGGENVQFLTEIAVYLGLLWNINRKSFWRIDMFRFRWPWVTFDQDYKVTTFLKSNISTTVHFRDKVTLKHWWETIPTLSNGTTFNDLEWPLTQILRSIFFEVKQSYYSTLLGNHTQHIELYHVWWPWLTSKCITRVRQHQLSFLVNVY